VGEASSKGIGMEIPDLVGVKTDHHRNSVKKDLNKHPIFKINPRS
jgi:hypothetical protein